jgi:hypothetical protein
VVLALIPADKKTDDRIIATVTNGKYRFEGESDFIQIAELRFEKDVIAKNLDYSFCPILLEPGLTVLNIGVKEEEGYTSFTFPEFVQGETNKNRINFYKEYAEASKGGTWVTRDSVRNDSLVKYIYPTTRKKVFDELFDQQFASGQHELNAILLKELVITGLNKKGLFNQGQLTTKQKDKLVSYFSELDQAKIDSAEYSLMDEVFRRLQGAVQPQAFQDIEVYEMNIGNGKLSEKVKENKPSMLYF